MSIATSVFHSSEQTSRACVTAPNKILWETINGGFHNTDINNTNPLNLVRFEMAIHVFVENSHMQ